MVDFANYLGERKHNFYHFLYRKMPQAYTTEQCLKRIEIETKYRELTDIIDRLPLEQKKIADDRFEELKETFSS